MEIFLATALILTSVFLTVMQVIRNVRFRTLADRRQKMIPFILGVNSILIFCDLMVGEGFEERVFADLCLSVAALSVMVSSFSEYVRWRLIVISLCVMESFLGTGYVLCAAGLIPHIPPYLPAVVMTPAAVLLFWVHAYGFWRKARNMRMLMQNGNVWSYVCVSVDSVYLAAFLMEVMFMAFLMPACVPPLQWVKTIMDLLMAALGAAVVFRISFDSQFVICRSTECMIIESMKISASDSSTASSKDKDLYKDLFDRVVGHFEDDKPYLRGDLTINDVVSVVFSNKLYISRAISYYTGRNFCQFVNYYRVMYSVDCFRQNTELRVADLWPMCGFNSIVSYNMAFRLFMGENPSDWCRKEKIRLSRKKTIFASEKTNN